MALSRKWGVTAASLFIVGTIFTNCGGGEANPSEGVSTTTTSAGTAQGFQNLTLGEVESINFSGSDATLNFTGSSGSDYLLIINSPNTNSADSTFQLSSESTARLSIPPSPSSEDDLGGIASSDEESPQNQFHQYLREMEGVFSQSDEFDEVHLSSQAGLTLTPQVGETKNFRVLSSLSSITNFQEVMAELKLVTDNLLIYVDPSAKGNLSQDDIQTLADDFEGIALPLERDLFGYESDVNADGHISILMTCVLNEMATSSGMVTGFFFPGDLYQRSTVNPASNAQEIFYTMVPDPDGKCGSPISASFTINNILPGVLAHEYQHMTSFNQHVFLNRGPTEEPWLNEGLSHFAEDLTGFGNENPSRVNLFLAQPSKIPLIPSTSPTLAERGASYLFLRYLYEQSGDGATFLKGLYSSSRTGISNIESAFASSDSSFDEFSEFLGRWSVALALSETGVTSDPRYNYQARTVHPKTGNFTGLCIRCDTQDGRGTVLGGPVITPVSSYPLSATLKATSSQFFRLNSPAGSIRVNGGSGSTSLKGSLVLLQKS